MTTPTEPKDEFSILEAIYVDWKVLKQVPATTANKERFRILAEEIDANLLRFKRSFYEHLDIRRATDARLAEVAVFWQEAVSRSQLAVVGYPEAALQSISAVRDVRFFQDLLWRVQREMGRRHRLGQGFPAWPSNASFEGEQELPIVPGVPGRETADEEMHPSLYVAYQEMLQRLEKAAQDHETVREILEDLESLPEPQSAPQGPITVREYLHEGTNRWVIPVGTTLVDTNGRFVVVESNQGSTVSFRTLRDKKKLTSTHTLAITDMMDWKIQSFEASK